MPRGRLTEKHVQRIAVNWLAMHYQSRSDVRAVVAEMEVVVTTAGFGRADGLIVAQRTDGSILTAALEAKSSRTVFNISLWHHDKRWFSHALTAAGISGLFVLWASWLAGVGGWMWGLSVVIFVLVGVGCLWLTREHPRYRKVDAIEQVKRYPANERWLAISADAYNLLAHPDQEDLRTECRREGIGLLHVQSVARVIPREVPRLQRLPEGCEDPLSCYARSARISQKLRAQVGDAGF